MDMGLFFIIILISGSFSEVMDNETLIYHWDVHHEIYYYCQFGTKQEVSRLDGNYEPQCFSRNRGMVHILQNGVKTFPYLSYGSYAGFILKCRDIPDADLFNCNRYVYTSCNYKCKSNDLIQEMKCELKGPKENITAEWSVTEPCSETNYNQSLSRGTQDILATSDKTIELEYITDSFDNKSDASPVTDAVTSTTAPLMAPSMDKGVLIAVTVTVTVVVTILLLLTLVFLWNKRRQKKLKRHKSSLPSAGVPTGGNQVVLYRANERSEENDLHGNEGALMLPFICASRTTSKLEEGDVHETRVKEAVPLALTASEEVNSKEKAPLLSRTETQDVYSPDIGHGSSAASPLFKDEPGMYEDISAFNIVIAESEEGDVHETRVKEAVPLALAASEEVYSKEKAPLLSRTGTQDINSPDIGLARSPVSPLFEDDIGMYKNLSAFNTATPLAPTAPKNVSSEYRDPAPPSAENKVIEKFIASLSTGTEDSSSFNQASLSTGTEDSSSFNQASASASIENQDKNNSNLDNKPQEGLSEFIVPGDLFDLKLDRYDKSPTDLPSFNKLLGTQLSDFSSFSSWEKTKKQLDEDNGIIQQD